MQKTLLTLIIICLGLTTYAQEQDTTSTKQDTSYWKRTTVLNINFSQVDLNNWAGGGNSSVAIGSLFNLKLDYEKGKDAWENRVNLAYGVQRQGDNDQAFVKTDDNIIFTSKYSRKITQKKFFMSALLDFRTQFYRGEEEVDGERQVISRFMSPAFLLANIGFTYRYKQIVSATFSPISSKTTFVLDDSLSAAGAYGVTENKMSRFQGGLNFSGSYSQDVFKNVNVSTNLNLFADYDKLAEVDVNWETAIVLKVNDFISSSITTQLIYDQDVKSKEIIVNEATNEVRLAPGIQFKSVINVGLSISF